MRCQIIMWLRLRGALRVGPACCCGRTEMMSAACMHILKSHRQTGGRGIVFFRFLVFFHVCFYSVFHSTGHLLDAVFPSFSLHSLSITQQPVFFSRGKHTCRAAHVKTADDVMGRQLIDKDRLQPRSPFINITSHRRPAEANEKTKRKPQIHIYIHVHTRRACTPPLDSFQPAVTLCSPKSRPLI